MAEVSKENINIKIDSVDISYRINQELNKIEQLGYLMIKPETEEFRNILNDYRVKGHVNILTKEEKQILKDYEDGKFVPAKDLNKVKRELKLVAKNTLDKTKNINIRITQKVLYKLRRKAIEEGIPYQTLVSSVLHKYVSQ